METILSRMTGEELLLLRILNGNEIAPSIDAELDHRARLDVAAPVWSRAGRMGRANGNAPASRLAA